MIFYSQAPLNIIYGMEKFLYRVQCEDSILSIAKRFNQCVFDLISENRLIKEVKAGDVLVITKKKENLYKIKPLEDANSLSKRYGVSVDSLLMKNGGVPYVFFGLEIKI